MILPKVDDSMLWLASTFNHFSKNRIYRDVQVAGAIGSYLTFDRRIIKMTFGKPPCKSKVSAGNEGCEMSFRRTL
jgi:hypothetical protein